MKILVTGASGNLGSAVVETLKARGIAVKAAARDPKRIANGTEVFRFDFADVSTHQAALQDVSGVFLVAPPMDPTAPELLNPFLDAACTTGVNHIILNSAFGVDQNERAPLRIVERHLMELGVAYTILRPNFFMENFSTGFIAPMIGQHSAFFLAADDGRTSFISVRDIAAVAVTAFAERLTGREYNLTGPRAVSRTEVAAIISEAAGKTIRYQPISEEDMLKWARDNGMPEGAVQYMAVLYQAVRAGWTEAVTPDVEQIAGRPSVSFEEFAWLTADVWK